MATHSVENLSTSGRLVLFAMQTHHHQQQPWVSKRDLGTSTRLPKRTLIKKLQQLVDEGLVEADGGKDESHGGYKATRYRLISDVPTSDELPSC